MEVMIENHLNRETKCPCCKSVFKYDYNDIQIHFPSLSEISVFGEEAMPFKYIKCPVCTDMIILKKATWPE